MPSRTISISLAPNVVEWTHTYNGVHLYYQEPNFIHSKCSTLAIEAKIRQELVLVLARREAEDCVFLHVSLLLLGYQK